MTIAAWPNGLGFDVRTDDGEHEVSALPDGHVVCRSFLPVGPTAHRYHRCLPGTSPGEAVRLCVQHGLWMEE